MRRDGKHLAGIGLLAVAAVLFSGCTTLFRPVEDPTRFYVLEAADYAPASVSPPADGAVLGLARVRVARYLEDPGIAIREAETRILYSQRHRWAESLEHGLTRLLAETLHEEPAVARVAPHPAQRRPLPDFDLHVAVSRAEGIRPAEGLAGARAAFWAEWELRAGVDAEVVASGRVRADDLPWDGEDYGQLTRSLSLGASELSREVAQAVEELSLRR